MQITASGCINAYIADDAGDAGDADPDNSVDVDVDVAVDVDVSEVTDDSPAGSLAEVLGIEGMAQAITCFVTAALSTNEPTSDAGSVSSSPGEGPFSGQFG